jgi:hypothetical protein
VACCCECGDEPPGCGATELVGLSSSRTIGYIDGRFHSFFIPFRAVSGLVRLS